MKIFLAFSLVILLLVGIIVMNGDHIMQNSSASTHNPNKVIHSISTPSGQLDHYDLAINGKMTEKHFSGLERKNLFRFIEINLDLMSGKITEEKIDKNDLNIKSFDYNIPKLSTEPIVSANMSYYFIIKNRTPNENGIVGRYSSFLERKSEKAPWNHTFIPFAPAFFALDLYTDFTQEELKSLGLYDLRKTFSDNDHESESIEGVNQDELVVFYNYMTSRNGKFFTISFAVSKKNYNPEEVFPKNVSAIEIFLLEV